MPGRDGSGPQGEGSLSGRGLGPCGSGLARGFRGGQRRGFGRGLGRGVCFDGLDKEAQKKILQDHKKEIEEKIAELDK
ncbi:MAG: DUF5320 domain-containing protein [Nanoarchaeota archaeon]|nr:DUF5320 domain-containing protein [Nanoarchaeota archaeon]MBU1321776.1 DUF5320 domain-containing protein [Nanoarchaeota archaeon]MBU1598475.1 DUF5320 domain-containing protein [Nanoarchaeota archaeon]MBU2440809.1 DUF5320 domain-containing protein [Nanoarchaeota archaeon]